MDIQQKFFDFTQLCPKEIPNCEKLRIDYNNEIEELKKSASCSGCVERNIRNKYLIFISSLTQNLNV
jgi:hypothetical protein